MSHWFQIRVYVYKGQMENLFIKKKSLLSSSHFSLDENYVAYYLYLK